MCKFRSHLKKSIFFGYKAPCLVSNIIGNKHNLTSTWIFHCIQLHQPCNHAEIISISSLLNLNHLQIAIKMILHCPGLRRANTIFLLHKQFSCVHYHERLICRLYTSFHTSIVDSITPLLLNGCLK